MQAVGVVVTPECLPAHFRLTAPEEEPDAGELRELSRMVERLLYSGAGDIYRRVLAEVDRTVLRRVLRYVRGNQVHASERLGLSRQTLRTKISRLGLDGEEPR